MNPIEENNEGHVEIVASDALERVEHAAIDMQISTAKKYPRNLSVVKKQMLDLATLDVDTAKSCFYVLKRKNADGTMKVIEGPSARMAEIAANSFGNMHAVSRIIGNDGKMITAQAVCHDLEKNVRIGVEVKRRITNKNGMTFSEDMQVVTGNAASSIALRNAMFKVIPMALIKPVYDAAKKCAVGDSKTLNERRTNCIAEFEKLGVTKDRVFASLQIKGVEDIGLAQLEVLIGMFTAIKDGDSTIDEMFPPANAAEVKKPLFGKPNATDAATQTVPASSVPTNTPPVEQKPEPNDLDKFRALITEAKRDEGVVLQFMRNTGMVEESLSSLDEVFKVAPTVIATAIKSWKKSMLPKIPA